MKKAGYIILTFLAFSLIASVFYRRGRGDGANLALDVVNTILRQHCEEQRKDTTRVKVTHLVINDTVSYYLSNKTIK